jgi:hypothetical protein
MTERAARAANMVAQDLQQGSEGGGICRQASVYGFFRGPRLPMEPPTPSDSVVRNLIDSSNPWRMLTLDAWAGQEPPNHGEEEALSEEEPEHGSVGVSRKSSQVCESGGAADM